MTDSAMANAVVMISSSSSPVVGTIRCSSWAAATATAIRACWARAAGTAAAWRASASAWSRAAPAASSASRRPWAQPLAYPADWASARSRSYSSVGSASRSPRLTSNRAAVAVPAAVPRTTVSPAMVAGITPALIPLGAAAAAAPVRTVAADGCAGTAAGAPMVGNAATKPLSADELIVVSPPDHDLARLLERADDLDDLGLRLLDLAQAYRAEHVDLVDEVLGGAFGQVAGDLVADVLADALERGGEVVGLDLAQDQLDAPVVEAGD